MKDYIQTELSFPRIIKPCLFKTVHVFQICTKLTRMPHIMHDFMLTLCYDLSSRFWVLVVDTSITEMGELIPDFIRIVVLACESAIRLFVHPNDKWMNARHKYPLSDIEFFPNNNQRFLNVLLRYPTALKFARLVDSLE